MKLPNGELGVVELAKLRVYSLSPVHPEGKHKARVFAAALGLTQADAERLREQLLAASKEQDCVSGLMDEHGQRYIVDFTATFRGKSAHLRSAWNVRPEENFPRLVSCYVAD